MYGKHFQSMYTGSMFGAGIHVFAVWGYVVSNGHYSSQTIELNPKLLAAILGAKEELVEDAIRILSSPDLKSRSKEHGGRRLLRQGEFLYFIPNLKKYRDTRNESDRREYMKVYMKNRRKSVNTDVNSSVNKSLLLAQGEGEAKAEGIPPIPPRGESLEQFAKNNKIPIKAPIIKKNNIREQILDIIIPETLRTDRFKKTWEEWTAYRIVKARSKDYPTMFQRQLKYLETLGEDLAIATMENTMMNEYQGFVFPKNFTPKKSFKNDIKGSTRDISTYEN